MKTNLHNIFKTNLEFEKEGVDYEVGSATFRVRRFGGANAHRIKAAMARHHKPYARQIEINALSEEKVREIMVKVFVEACLVGWSGVTDEDGKEIEFSQQAAVQLFTSLPELGDTLYAYCNDGSNYKDLGNS